MAELWATNELPGVAWNDEPPDDTPDPDLWGQTHHLLADENDDHHHAQPGVPVSRELTARQRQVLAHVANGRTNAQIGHHLSLSPFTIGRHLAEIFRTLGAKDRANAVAIALATGELGVQQIRIPDQQREPAT